MFNVKEFANIFTALDYLRTVILPEERLLCLLIVRANAIPRSIRTAVMRSSRVDDSGTTYRISSNREDSGGHSVWGVRVERDRRSLVCSV